jgi:hypothetical protein
MPNAYVLNQTPTTYSGAHWLLIQMLVGAGWQIKSSGDGLAGYNATGSVFSSGSASGANGFGQAKAWARLTDPGGVREILYQHDNAGGLRLKYSPSAKFTAGSPSATVTPSATDEVYLRGASSDATPSYGATWFDTGVLSGFTKFQGAAQSSSPYGFWFAGASTPAGTIKTGVCMDPVSSVAEDLDPVVWHLASTGAFATSTIAQSAGNNGTYPANGGTAQGNWGFADVAKALFRAWQGACYYLGDPTVASVSMATSQFPIFASGLVVNPFNSKNEGLPIAYMRHSSQSNAGLKGWSTQMRWTTVARTTFQDTADSKNWIVVGAVFLPWDGVTAPTN